MPTGCGQFLLLSDNDRLSASLEGARSGGQFRVQRLTRPEQLEPRLADLLTTIDGAIVDGTAPCFFNGQLERVLMTLDCHQVGALLLTPGAAAGPGPAKRLLIPDGLPLVWRVAVDRLDSLDSVLQVIAGYQQVVRNLQREIRLFQRLDHRISGRFTEIDEEMRLASRIQQDFLPKSLPAVGPAQFATVYRPVSWVSGDLYDVFRLDETHVGFYIADAVGHGMPAALLTMFIKRSMETKHVGEGGYRLLGPEETLRLLNQALLAAGLSENQFTTAVYAILDVTTLKLDFARGGHPDPIRLHHDGTTSEPEADGGLLGVFAETEFTRGTVQLVPGDKLIIYSDGLEMVFVEGDQVSSQRYRAELEAARGLPIGQMLTQFLGEMDRQAGSLSPRDDVTIVGLEIAR